MPLNFVSGYVHPGKRTCHLCRLEGITILPVSTFHGICETHEPCIALSLWFLFDIVLHNNFFISLIATIRLLPVAKAVRVIVCSPVNVVFLHNTQLTHNLTTPPSPYRNLIDR